MKERKIIDQHGERKEGQEKYLEGERKVGKDYTTIWGKEGGERIHQHWERNYGKEYTAIFGKKGGKRKIIDSHGEKRRDKNQEGKGRRRNKTLKYGERKEGEKRDGMNILRYEERKEGNECTPNWEKNLKKKLLSWGKKGGQRKHCDMEGEGRKMHLNGEIHHR